MKKFLILLLIPLLYFTPLLVIRQFDLQPRSVASPVSSTNESNACEINITLTTSPDSLPLETYLVGVVSGEMPASFELEALKAQAIAARTYAIHQTNYGETAINTTIAHQVFENEQQRQKKWLSTFQQYEQKIQQAIEETADKILVYNNEPISAMFHASSYQNTESAKNYSDNSISYLQSVQTPEQVKPQITQWTVKKLNNALQINATLAQYQKATIIQNDTKHVEKIQIADQTWTGREFRDALELQSTKFSIEPTQKGVNITTLGNGHGVGMSQYGANELAKQGYRAEQIVAHYYPNTSLETISCPPPNSSE